MNALQFVQLYSIASLTNFLNHPPEKTCIKNPFIPTYPSGYNWITDTVAIGDMYSSYDEFDVIINLQFPQNQVNDKDILFTYHLGKTIYYIGILDSSEKNNKGQMISLLDTLIPELAFTKQNNHNLRFLFHCYAGISRSVTVATAFLVKTLAISMEDALYMVKSKRTIADPNPLFLKELEMYVS